MAYGIASSTRDILSRKDIESMSMGERKVYENRLRRVADRRGYRLESRDAATSALSRSACTG
jgi:hypothetical protein